MKEAGYETDTVIRLETNLDDCPSEIIGAVMEQLLAAGALDVWFTPIQMKKQRPGILLSALGAPSVAVRLTEIIFRETTAFGLRREEIVRLKLGRRFETVQTEFGEVVVKLGLKGEEIVQVAPEFESCRALSERTGRPLREVYAAAQRAFHAPKRPGA